MVTVVSVPNSPVEALLRTLSQLLCTISAGGQGCAVIL